jgi:putative oxidoreductase
MKGLRSILLFIGRICLCTIFLLAGLGKLMDYSGTAAMMASKGMTLIPLFLYAAAAVEIIGALSLLLGYRTRYGVAILLLFLIPTTLIFHDFWNYTGPEQQLQMIMFLKNLAIFGGLLYVLAFGAGGFSIDAFRHRHIEKKI